MKWTTEVIKPIAIQTKWRWLGDQTTTHDGSNKKMFMECDSRSQDWTVSSLTGSKKDKLCLVCGDKALGYNFNAVSCESCKAFFRRNAHKTIRGRCEGKCDVNVESRSFCKRCRLQKCFTVGMRKDMILNEQQKKVRKQKIIINKLKKHGQLPMEESGAGTSEELSEEFEARICAQSLDELRSTFPNLSEKELGMLSKLKQENVNEQKTSCSGQVDESCPAWVVSQEMTEKIIAKMPEMNRSILRELLRANEQSAFLANTSTEIKSIPTNATEFFNVAEGFVRRIIKLAKNIEFFKMVTKDDQIALLKGSVVEIMMLRSAVNYNVATETWNLSTKSCLNTDQASSSSGVPGKEPLGASLPHSSQTSNVAANSKPQSADLTNLPNVFPSKDKSSQAVPDTSGIKMEMGKSTSSFKTGASIDIEKLRAQIPGGADLSKLRAQIPGGADLSKLHAQIPGGTDLSQLRAQFSSGADLSQLRAQFSSGADLSKLRAQFEQKMKDGTLRDSPAMKIGAELLKNGNSETRAMFMSYATFIKSLMKTIHGDVLMLKILIMLSLFSSDREGLEEKHKIEEIQECYAQILQAYVKERFPEENILFAKVIMKLTDLRDINELHTKMLLKMKVESIEPLLVEIFDLPL